ncbi:hypothetical protein ACTXM3_18270 [Glutamicibacter arilaitensis]|uniref:hypothetical protein n=1 Tax=Glutamicibacter TaxID=1742989 RepID=UPI003F8F6BDD
MTIDPKALIDNIHVIIVEIDKPDSVHYRKRSYFNLPSAQRAVDRATERGQSAQLILCKLIPVGGAPGD